MYLYEYCWVVSDFYDGLHTEPIDEDDFLYGSSSNTQVEQSSLAQPALKPKFDEKPDAQKIISNPAFTALLKSIGLDDINMAQKIKVLF